MKVSIQERHIREGQQCKSAYCPLALAVREKYALGEYDIGVCADEVVIDWPKETALYIPDEAGKQFVRKFDKGLEVEPIEIELTRQDKVTAD